MLVRLFARPPNNRWGVVQPVGHHTVNVDGEGSNPSAPANSSFLKDEKCSKKARGPRSKNFCTH